MPPQFKSRLVIPAGFAHATVKLTGPNTLHPPSFGFGVSGDAVESTADTIREWLDLADDGFLANLHPNYTVDRLILRGNTTMWEVPLSQAGTSPGVGTTPPAVATLVKLVTAAAGRRGRGRMYWPGVIGDSDINAAGNIADGTGLDATGDVRFGDLQLCASALLTTLADGLNEMVVLHSYRWDYGDADPGVPGGFPAPTEVTGIGVQRAVATQRRRQR